MTLVPGFPGHDQEASFADVRRDLEGAVVRDAAGKLRAGIFYAHPNPLVTARADMRANILDFRAVQDRGGAIFLANVGTTISPQFQAAPTSNRRIDLLYATQQSTRLGDTANTPVFEIRTGTPSATPSAPSLPANRADALPLATVEIPAGATSLQSSGVVITPIYPYTAMAGGTVVVRNQVELAAWQPANGARAHSLADNRDYVRKGGAWRGSGSAACTVKGTTRAMTSNGGAMTWDTEHPSRDTHGFASASQPTRLTIPTGMGGLYRVEVALRATGTAPTLSEIRVNGGVPTDVAGSSFGASGAGTSPQYFGELVLGAGDYIYVLNTSGSGGTLGSWASSGSWFSLVLIETA